MGYLSIRKFGPIESIENFDDSKNCILIGPQACGKSTLAKTIYFFKKVRFATYELILKSFNENNYSDFQSRLNKEVRDLFFKFWGSAEFFDKNMCLECKYTEGRVLTLKRKGTSVGTRFSEELFREINELVKVLVTSSRGLNRSSNGFLSRGDEIIANQVNRSAIIRDAYERLKIIFNDDTDLLYVPAGRNIVSVIKEGYSVSGDYPTKEFLERVTLTKELFENGLDGVTKNNHSYKESNKSDGHLKRHALDLISQILKGKYHYKQDSDRIYFDSQRFVSLGFASSGQQESVWFLNLLYLLILEQSNFFVIFEEPEAHLFPTAQRGIIKLLSLFINSGSKNRLLITTHSPYILSSLNNHIYAGKLSKTMPKKTKQVMDDFLWLDPDLISALFMSNGSVKSILDKETSLIDTDFIDGLSEELNNEFDQLLDLEVQSK